MYIRTTVFCKLQNENNVLFLCFAPQPPSLLISRQPKHSAGSQPSPQYQHLAVAVRNQYLVLTTCVIIERVFDVAPYARILLWITSERDGT